MNSGSFINFRICGPLKISDLTFSSLSPWNRERSYLKQSSSLLRVSANCLINPSLIFKGGKTIFSLSTSASLFTLALLTIKFCLFGHSFLIQSSFALLSHIHKKQGYFVYPPCCPRKKQTFLDRHR